MTFLLFVASDKSHEMFRSNSLSEIRFYCLLHHDHEETENRPSFIILKFICKLFDK